ncbi:MAG: flagellar basal body rod protein FlgB [Dehalococcoidia bacterium]|nr:flagellar basal body rod protein FlgB [Dehalococcoidia bacterium]
MTIDPLGDTTTRTATAWLHGLSRRQEAISNNIANIDTPGYQREEVSFETALGRALAGHPSPLRVTDPRHFSASPQAAGGLGLERTQQLASARRDGNTVDVDQEMVDLAETQMRYQAAASAISTHLETIRTAIRG